MFPLGGTSCWLGTNVNNSVWQCFCDIKRILLNFSFRNESWNSNFELPLKELLLAKTAAALRLPLPWVVRWRMHVYAALPCAGRKGGGDALREGKYRGEWGQRGKCRHCIECTCSPRHSFLPPRSTPRSMQCKESHKKSSTNWSKRATVVVPVRKRAQRRRRRTSTDMLTTNWG